MVTQVSHTQVEAGLGLDSEGKEPRAYALDHGTCASNLSDSRITWGTGAHSRTTLP